MGAMSERLPKKKKIQGGHRLSTTRIVDRELVMTTLLQCTLTLKEKLETIKRYDDEILELVGVENEIKQADIFKERIHRAILSGQPSGIRTNRQYIAIHNCLTLISLFTSAHYWKVQLQSQYRD